MVFILFSKNAENNQVNLARYLSEKSSIEERISSGFAIDDGRNFENLGTLSKKTKTSVAFAIVNNCI